jgi:GTPase
MLVAAFRATLEEVINADLILHVRDIAHSETHAQCADVEAVLSDLGIDARAAKANILEVWNKVDLLDSNAREEALHASQRRDRTPALVSAITGEGLEALLRHIDTRFSANDEELELAIPASDGAILAWLHDNADVMRSDADDDGTVHAHVRIATAKKGRLLSRLHNTGVRVGV